MPDNPDPENLLHHRDTHPGGRPRRSGVEPIPMLDAADTVTLEIEILRESYNEILQVIEANEWEGPEGLRTVLLTGLGYLDASIKLDTINRTLDGDPQAAQRIDRMVRDLVSYHSMYSVMKFKAFKLYKLSQTLEFNVAGLRATDRMWEEWADRMRREQAELQAEALRLRALMSEFALDWDRRAERETPTGPLPIVMPIMPSLAHTEREDEKAELGEQPADKPSFWSRLRRLLGGD